MKREDAIKIYNDLAEKAGGKENLKDSDIPLDVLCAILRSDKLICEQLEFNNIGSRNKIIEVDFKNKRVD